MGEILAGELLSGVLLSGELLSGTRNIFTIALVLKEVANQTKQSIPCVLKSLPH